MGDLTSARSAAAYYRVSPLQGQEPATVYTTGHTILTRVQEALARHQWPAMGETTAYRRGGPLDAADTAIRTRDIAIDGMHGPLTNGMLWAYCAEKAAPSATQAERIAGRIFDAGTRNVLDKIEESLKTGTLHYTAARAMLWVIENARNPALTWQRFIAEANPTFTENAFVGYRLRARLPKPTSVAGLMLLPTAAPATKRIAIMLGLRRTLGPFEGVTADQIRAILTEAVPANLASFLGQTPRITREYTGALEAGVVRVAARWAAEIDAPNPAAYTGSVERALQTFRQFIIVRLGEDAAHWEITATPYDIAINGDLSWWRNGASAQSATRDDPRIGVAENPEGPSEARPAVQGTGEKALDAAKSLGAIAATLGAIYVGAKVIGLGSSVVAGRSKRVEILTGPRPNNPSRKR